jgi:CBS-domain-containing membrane protein
MHTAASAFAASGGLCWPRSGHRDWRHGVVLAGLLIPFATSIALVIGSPEAEPAQPRALIGGHVVATLVGFAMLRLAGPHGWAAATAVGLAVLAMIATGTFHPPAGINPLLVVVNNLPGSFLLAPVLAGAVLLTAFAYFWQRWVCRRPWPRQWL